MDIKDLVSELSQITNSDNPDKIKRLLLSIKGKIVIPTLILGKGSRIFRASHINNISDITSYQRLSYKPASMNKTYQRASSPNNTMFYGIVSNNYTNAVMGCFGETCDCLRNTDIPNKHYKIVISEWELLNDVQLVQMIDPNGNNKSKVFTNHKEFVSIIKKHNADNKGSNKDFLCFINKEFKKNCYKESDYWISATYTEFLTQILGYNGIVYESVQAIDPALCEVKCVAFTPNFTDKNLNFIKGYIYEFDFNGKDIPIEPYKTGIITFKANQLILHSK